MGTVLREYETLFVLHPELAEEGSQKILDRLKESLGGMNAELLHEDVWGKRKFAFAVKKQMRGNFMKFHYVGKPGTCEELERTMRNIEGVIRFLTTVHGTVTDVEARRQEIAKEIQDAIAAKAKKEAERAAREAEASAAAPGQ